MNTNKRYAPEVREQAVRLVLEQQGEREPYGNGCVGPRLIKGNGWD